MKTVGINHTRPGTNAHFVGLASALRAPACVGGVMFFYENPKII